jgi:hypothetical protein
MGLQIVSFAFSFSLVYFSSAYKTTSYEEGSMADNPDVQQPQPIKIITTDEVSRGRYSNMILASHSADEFMLDWLLNSPNGPHLVARLILSPANLKRTIETLKLSLQQYEKQFGVVKLPEPDDQKVH